MKMVKLTSRRGSRNGSGQLGLLSKASLNTIPVLSCSDTLISSQLMLKHDFDLQVSQLQALSNRDAIVEPIQQTVSVVLQEHLNNPALKRSEVRAALRVLSQPMTRAALNRLKSAYQAYTTSGNVAQLLASVKSNATGEPTESKPQSLAPTLTADDLQLVCWEYVWS